MLARFLPALALILLPEPALAEKAHEEEAAGWDWIAFEMNSWGRPVSSWRIRPTGDGSWTQAVSPDGQPFGDYSLVWHEVTAGEEGFARLSAILAGLPEPAPAYDDCENSMTDQPYGIVRLTRGATTTEIAYNAGCLDDGYVAFLDVLREANQLVEGWGKAGKVLRTEKPGAAE